MSLPYLTIIDESQHENIDYNTPKEKKKHGRNIKKERKKVDDRRI
jgi:hypothetical protein